MHLFVSDSQAVGETIGTLFSFQNAGPVAALVSLHNAGTYPLTYRFQEFDGTEWVDLDQSGTDLYNTLNAGEALAVFVSSTFAQVRVYGNAETASVLDFSVTLQANRESGGLIPLLY